MDLKKKKSKKNAEVIFLTETAEGVVCFAPLRFGFLETTLLLLLELLQLLLGRTQNHHRIPAHRATIAGQAKHLIVHNFAVGKAERQVVQVIVHRLSNEDELRRTLGLVVHAALITNEDEQPDGQENYDHGRQDGHDHSHVDVTNVVRILKLDFHNAVGRQFHAANGIRRNWNS